MEHSNVKTKIEMVTSRGPVLCNTVIENLHVAKFDFHTVDMKRFVCLFVCFLPFR